MIEKTNPPKEEITIDGLTADITVEVKDPVIGEMIPVPDIKSIWTGTFDGKINRIGNN